MLEDANIQHLISWSASNESFVVSPSGEFSKVLRFVLECRVHWVGQHELTLEQPVFQTHQYILLCSSAQHVRLPQRCFSPESRGWPATLTVFSVNDVFHTGSPDSTLWEFKHGNGSFKRGDLVGLREIKRRASRHALIHRDSFSGTKSAAVSVPGTPNEQPTDSVEARLLSIEQSLFDVTTRLSRTEDNNAYLSARCQIAVEGFSRCHRVSPAWLGILRIPYSQSAVRGRDRPVHV
jgi:hypothetical protein